MVCESMARPIQLVVLVVGILTAPSLGQIRSCDVTTGCNGAYSCDDWVNDQGATCAGLESNLGCDCSGCVCGAHPTFPSTTTTGTTATTATTTAPHNPTTEAPATGAGTGSVTEPANHHRATTEHPEIDIWAVPENPYWRQWQNYVDAFNEVIETVDDVLEEEEEVDEGLTAARIIITIILCCFSALFSGLTLGLMGLDTAGLDVIVQADPDGINGRRAAKILVLRRDGNLLLCTLLLGNVAVNALVPIFLEELVDETASFIISTFVLVIVGEITPQAICSRYALAIGASVIWIMRIFTVLLYVIAKPIAMILDRILGEEMGTIYNKNELIEIVKHHKDQGALDMDEAAFVKGALEYTSKSVWEVFTPVNQVYMLSADDVLDYNLISDIFKQGHSRIPVKAANTDSESGKEMKIVGILLVKDLILLDPENCVPVRDVLRFFNRPVITVDMADSLVEVMDVFKENQFHLAMVTNAATDEMQPGLEIVVHSPLKPKSVPDASTITQESLLQDDEEAFGDDGLGDFSADVGGDGNSVAMVPLKSRDRSASNAANAKSLRSLQERKHFARQLNPVLPQAPDQLGSVDSEKEEAPSGKMKQLMGIITLEDIIECLLGTQIYDEGDHAQKAMVAARWTKGGSSGTKEDGKINLLSAVRTRISEDVEMDIIINHLLENVRPFQIKRHGYQISEYALTHMLRECEIKTFKRGDVVIERGVHTDSMLLVLDGTLETETGRDKFKAIAGSLSTIADGALAFPEDNQWHYIPDFTVTVASSKSRVLLIRRQLFCNAYVMTRERDVQALRSILSTNAAPSTRKVGPRAVTVGVAAGRRARVTDPEKHVPLL